MDRITIRRIYDMHCHLRTGQILEMVLRFMVAYAGRAVIMPNTRPRAILTAEDVRWYLDMIMTALSGIEDGSKFRPLMTIELRDNTTPRTIEDARKAGAVAVKIYPHGMTTHADQGLRSFTSDSFFNNLAAVRDRGMLCLIHGEVNPPRTLVTRREAAFLPTLRTLALAFPGLKFVLEHVTTREGVEVVRELGPNVAATITAHHLCTTLNDVIGDGVRPHNACNPMPKDFDDRDALIAAATSGDPKFFLGSDSAPHLVASKECAKGACGVFTAPILPQLLTQTFGRAGRLERLQDFTSTFGAAFYELPVNTDTITLQEEVCPVPTLCGGVVPFLAGQDLEWQIAKHLGRPLADPVAALVGGN